MDNNVQNIEKSLDQIEDVLESGSRFALTNKTVIDAEPIKTAIEDIRLNLPAEIAQARAVVADRNSILVKARDEAVNTTTTAQDKARAMLTSAEAKVKEMVSKTAEFANKRVAEGQAQAQALNRDPRPNAAPKRVRRFFQPRFSTSPTGMPSRRAISARSSNSGFTRVTPKPALRLARTGP